MKVEFDPAKDEMNRAKHGVSLQAAANFDWDTAVEREDDRFDYGEVRFFAIGLIDAPLRDDLHRRLRRRRSPRHQPAPGGET